MSDRLMKFSVDYSEWRRVSGLQDTEYLRRAFEAGQRLGGRR